MSDTATATGLDVFLEHPDIAGPVGLLTNAASQTRYGQTAVRALREAGVNVAALFTPEHGFYAVGTAGEAIADSTVEGITAYSLYPELHSLAAEALNTVSAVIVDLQDAGLRWYTFIAAVQTMLRVCAVANVPVIVFDRPNPQGGIIVEGMPAQRELFSYVAPAALPVRYGMTLGEVAQWLNSEIGAHLEVVRMRGWERHMFYPETGLMWCAPSPGIPTPHTALVYTGTCLVESITLSEGRGTALPFEQVGAPFIHAESFADTMNALKLSGVAFRPTWFRPISGKYAGETCGGLRVYVTEPAIFEGFRVGLYLVHTAMRLYPNHAQWIVHDGQNAFDRLVGTTYVRKALERDLPVDEVLEVCTHEARVFQSSASEFWLYE